MKKIIIIFLLLFSITSNVKANEVIKADTNVKVIKTTPYGERYKTSLYFIYVDGKIAYCIEPGMILYEGDYEEATFEKIGITDEQKDKMEIIAYYGYQYKNHNTLEYYMATQALIWEVLGCTNVEFENINIDHLKQEILSLVENHKILPSFNGKTIESYPQEKHEIIDTNNTLQNFTVEKNNASIEGNKLSFITGNEDFEINLNEKNTNGETGLSLAYFKNSSQTVASFLLNSNRLRNAKLFVKVKPRQGKLIIEKQDDNTKIPLENAEFTLFNENKEIIGTYKTNNNGIIQIDNLNYGNYYLKENKAPKGYLLKDELISITVGKDEQKFIITNTKYEMPITSNLDKKVLNSSFTFFSIGIILLYVYKKINIF